MRPVDRTLGWKRRREASAERKAGVAELTARKTQGIPREAADHSEVAYSMRPENQVWISRRNWPPRSISTLLREKAVGSRAKNSIIAGSRRTAGPAGRSNSQPNDPGSIVNKRPSARADAREGRTLSPLRSRKMQW